MAKTKNSDDYELVETIDEKGRSKQKAVYIGDYFEVLVDEESLLRFRRNSFFLLFVFILIYFNLGFINNQGMDNFYVIFPYVFGFFPLIYLAGGIISLPREKRKLKRDEVNFSFKRIAITSKFLLGLLGVGILGEIVFLLITGINEQFMKEILFLGFEILGCGVMYLIIFLQNKIPTQIIAKK